MESEKEIQNENHERKEGEELSAKAWIIGIYCGIISLCALPIGWDIGTAGQMVSGEKFQDTYKSPSTEKTEEFGRISSVMIGVIVSSFNLGCVVGCIGLSKICSLVGFKRAIIVSSGIHGIGSLIQILCGYNKWSVWAMIFGRVLCGVCCGTACVIAPRFMNHLAVLPNKSMFLSFFQTSVCTAILAGNIMNWVLGSNFIGILICQLIIVTLAGVLITVVPESHIHFLNKGDNDRASDTLRRLYTVESEHDEEKLKTILEKWEGPETLPKRWVTNPSYYIPLVHCCIIIVFQQLSGINYFFYYGAIIFRQIGIDVTLVAIIMGSVNLVGSLVSNLIVGHFSRRALLLIGSALMTILLGIYLALSVWPFGASQVLLVLVTCSFITCFAVTWGPVAGIIINYTSRNINSIIGVTNSVGFISNCVITVLSPLLIEHLGFYISLIFASSMLVSIIYLHNFSYAD
ncbi:Piso0_001251 [Millerozyma farinosa CBS 7064]|uniref:Piso0_001251 protein n=1 Tax=Pichia sorbitophila (strain ATCC MYA-4447 / BCRC 22081 / CBS 7064 / NBRC 10061 / NRRL Y-12695) TaxID=559304 RepID=G8YMN5_PICSO|nr:Piso0_001251 [Millerozyma farinosa CBS 7064]